MDHITKNDIVQAQDFLRAYWREVKRLARVAKPEREREYKRGLYRRNMEKYAERGAELAAKRKAAGLSQRQFAEALGVTQGAVSLYETGRVRAQERAFEALEVLT